MVCWSAREEKKREKNTQFKKSTGLFVCKARVQREKKEQIILFWGKVKKESLYFSVCWNTMHFNDDLW